MIVEGKCIHSLKHYDVKMYAGVEIEIQAFLTSALDCGE
jgi:hypothetical protein